LNRDQSFIQISSKYHLNMLLKKDKTKFKTCLRIWPFRPESPAHSAASKVLGPAQTRAAALRSAQTSQPTRAGLRPMPRSRVSSRPSVALWPGPLTRTAAPLRLGRGDPAATTPARPSSARAAHAHAQAATWAWAGKVATRLGRFWPDYPEPFV
jgi:hypothetical protein